MLAFSSNTGLVNSRYVSASVGSTSSTVDSSPSVSTKTWSSLTIISSSASISSSARATPTTQVTNVTLDPGRLLRRSRLAIPSSSRIPSDRVDYGEWYLRRRRSATSTTTSISASFSGRFLRKTAMTRTDVRRRMRGSERRDESNGHVPYDQRTHIVPRPHTKTRGLNDVAGCGCGRGERHETITRRRPRLANLVFSYSRYPVWSLRLSFGSVSRQSITAVSPVSRGSTIVIRHSPTD